MNSPQHPHHGHHDVHQQRLLWFFSFCNQRSSSSSGSSTAGSTSASRRQSSNTRRKTASNRNKFAIQYQQQLQQQQRQSSNVFGRDLTEHTQKYSDQDSIPHIVKSCSKFIEKHGIIFGIYRLSGMRVNIHKLRQDFDKNPKISMIDNESITNDAHAVACVLKQYFRELPTPLLTFHMYERFIQLFKHCNTNHNTNTNNKNNNINSSNSSSNSNINNTTPTSTPTPTSTSTATPTPAPTPTSTATTTPNINDNNNILSLSSVVTTTTSDIKYQVNLNDLRKLLLQLPRAHYQTLKYLMRHLACIAANGQKTGMDSKNVAIVWAPNLLKPRELELSAGMETLQVIGLQAVITEQLIKHHRFLFKKDKDRNDDDIDGDGDDDDEDEQHNEEPQDHLRHHQPQQLQLQQPQQQADDDKQQQLTSQSANQSVVAGDTGFTEPIHVDRNSDEYHPSHHDPSRAPTDTTTTRLDSQ